jgi:hypothetical protein
MFSAGAGSRPMRRTSPCGCWFTSGAGVDMRQRACRCSLTRSSPVCNCGSGRCATGTVPLPIARRTSTLFDR